MQRKTTVGLWRWRRNSLRRHSDVVEAWAVLVTILLVAVGMPLAGLLTAVTVSDVLAHQRQERHRTVAVLTEDAGYYAAGTYNLATVRWTAPDGAVRTVKARVAVDAKAGSTTTIWTDRQGRATTRPPTAGQATGQSVVAGSLAALGAGALLLFGERLVRLRLDLRRADQWELDWARFGPRWGTKHG